MNTYTVSFFGHRTILNSISVEEKLDGFVHSLASQHSYVSFLVGRDGDFDLLASSVVHRYKRLIRNDNCSLTWVMPYLTAEYRNNEETFWEYYDEIEVCEKSSVAYYRSAFQIRNRDLVDRSDLIIFFVEHKSGGAYQTMRYALNQGKQIINLGQV